ncbi:hypothetical protein [Streptomyces sp. N35]|uniref:hypothetical protein n=1 Tax=Streptomyces sp. N35 TaxID=2795730 RepID=UPI0018F4C0FC|nr:hypothetical protein [Streptomyces sp. N35]
MELRGIDYDTGTAYSRGELTRTSWDPSAVRRDLRVIREELHCTTVCLFGSSVERLAQAADWALRLGLDVWLQPRRPTGPREGVLTQLVQAAKAAEELRLRHGDRITLVAGCEHSLFAQGILPGPTFTARLAVLQVMGRRLHTRTTRRLNSLLARAASLCRTHFSGPLTYAAGFWEEVDWDLFDVVGVNLYRLSSNEQGYEESVAALRRFGKPVVITEFGCCTFEGAERLGPGGYRIVNWFRSPPTVKQSCRRDEHVQARYLEELLAVYAASQVHGAFAFVFSEPSNPHSADPRHDLDMASFGVVKVSALDPDAWETKEAFHSLARVYGALGSDGADLS